ncbi:biliverdin-producing heme oxygenase [Roseobacter sp. S98]|uniref:biliverdin-producing heme oxygenase n=1 Tax=Roseobacter algicola (ex Choi et al. 2025) (nom. illeg.) TaxID=3092138 RepID=UPI003F51977A
MNHQNAHRDVLREATQAAHSAAENVWFGEGHFASLPDYRAWLTRMLEVHETLGLAAATAVSPDLFLPQETARCVALRRDLDLEPVGAGPDRAMPDSHAWGVLYALNGSALGASHIHREVSGTRDWPLRYLAEMRTYATSGGVKEFFDRLNAAGLDTARALDGALDVFDRISAAKIA